MALSWRAQETIRNVVVIALLAGGAYAVYRYIEADGGVQSDECHQERAQMVEACRPICEDSGEVLVPLHDVQHGKIRPDCLENCVWERFGRRLPVCDSRR